MTEICTFFAFTHVRQTCFAYNFFGAFLNKFFNGFIKVILVLFQTLKPNAQKTAQKMKKNVFS